MNYLAVIDETIEYYSSHPRAVDRLGNCIYLAPNGAKCAVGRLLKCDVPAELNFRPVDELIPILLRHGYDTGVSLLDIPFLEDLQDLHDRNTNWTDSGLSDLGIKAAEELRKKHANN